MNKVFLALSLALILFPVAAFADDQPAAPPTAAQRQAMFKTFEAFRGKAQQLQQQFRSQLLGALSSTHRAAVANLIGQLAVSSNPDPRAAARQLDAVLSQSEQQRILSASASFHTQSKALHDQIRQQLRSEMPAGGPPPDEHMGQRPGESHEMHAAPDAGTVLIKVLSHFEPVGMEHHMWGGPPPPPR